MGGGEIVSSLGSGGSETFASQCSSRILASRNDMVSDGRPTLVQPNQG